LTGKELETIQKVIVKNDYLGKMRAAGVRINSAFELWVVFKPGREREPQESPVVDPEGFAHCDRCLCKKERMARKWLTFPMPREDSEEVYVVHRMDSGRVQEFNRRLVVAAGEAGRVSMLRTVVLAVQRETEKECMRLASHNVVGGGILWGRLFATESAERTGLIGAMCQNFTSEMFAAFRDCKKSERYWSGLATGLKLFTGQLCPVEDEWEVMAEAERRTQCRLEDVRGAVQLNKEIWVHGYPREVLASLVGGGDGTFSRFLALDDREVDRRKNLIVFLLARFVFQYEQVSI
jgi:hypothetical protein